MGHYVMGFLWCEYLSTNTKFCASDVKSRERASKRLSDAIRLLQVYR